MTCIFFRSGGKNPTGAEKERDIVLRGVSRRVVVIKSPDRRLFEEAIFIVRGDIPREDPSAGRSVVREAQKVADSYIRSHLRKRRFKRLPAPVYAAVGAAATGLVWLATYLF